MTASQCNALFWLLVDIPTLGDLRRLCPRKQTLLTPATHSGISVAELGELWVVGGLSSPPHQHPNQRREYDAFHDLSPSKNIGSRQIIDALNGRPNAQSIVLICPTSTFLHITLTAFGV